MNPVLAFQSRSFPADAATDPAKSESDAGGVPLLSLLLQLLRTEGFTRHSGPTAEGSGSSACVECDQGHTSIHLTWYATGGRSGRFRVVWTLQVGPSRGGLRQALQRVLGSPDVVRGKVLQAIQLVLSAHREEFFDVRSCTWAELDQ